MTHLKGSKNNSVMWGGRFAAGPSAVMEKINASIGFDQRLHAQDIEGSRAHCRMLVEKNIIPRADGNVILDGLDQVAHEIAEGKFEFKKALEDIHMNIEARLSELIGKAAGRLHTARSRNDQVATDLRLWVRSFLDDLDQGVMGLQEILIAKAEFYADAAMPGYTHLQAAQPVTLGHHLLAYVEMLGRDRGRIADCRARLNESPLGAAALAGTSFPIDRHMTAEALGFDRPMENSLDAVSDRDFALEFLGLGSILAVHLSRLAEEIVIWSTDHFAFLSLSDDFSTGSSIMPQKRNPDAAELIRAKAGRILGSLNTLMVVMKGLPLAYGKDMQEDKEPVFDAADTLALCVAAMAGMLEKAAFNAKRMRAALEAGFPTATDLADWLVRTFDMPFRQAHHVTGQLVKMAESRGCSLEELPVKDMQAIDPRITEDVLDILKIDNALRSRTSYGGAAPDNVRMAAVRARERFLGAAVGEKIK